MAVFEMPGIEPIELPQQRPQLQKFALFQRARATAKKSTGRDARPAALQSGSNSARQPAEKFRGVA